MNYNILYRKKDKISRKRTNEEKQNLWKIAKTAMISMLVGLAFGVVVILLLK